MAKNYSLKKIKPKAISKSPRAITLPTGSRDSEGKAPLNKEQIHDDSPRSANAATVPDQEAPVLSDEETTKQKLLERAVTIACEQLETSMKLKQPRMQDVRMNEDVYFGKPKVALRNRFNVPFDSVVMQGAIDTVMARSDDSVKLGFEADAEEYKRSGLKVTAAFERDSSDAVGRWDQKDRLAKKMAYLSGRAIYEIHSESLPRYRNVLKVIDHNDFQCEPGGGPYLEDHLFCGTINNFFSKESLKKGAEDGLYIAAGVQKLIDGMNPQDRKELQDEYRNRQDRLQALGLDLDQNNYIGTTMYNLTKWEMVLDGERYYLLFDPKQKVGVRFEKLSDVARAECPDRPDNLYTFVTWATEDSPMFWNRGQADTIRPVAEVYRVLVNGMLENIQKRNWNNRAYDPNVFTDPSKLLYTPDGLAKANWKPGMTSIAQGIYEFNTPDTTGVTLNAIEWLNSFIGEKTGISPGAEGQTKDTKVGIYYGNVQAVSERFGLLNKSYTQARIDLGVRYDWGLSEHCPEEMMVKIMGIEGVGWEALKKEDTTPDYTVKVVSTNAEAEKSAMKSAKKADALTKIQANPTLLAKVNASWLLEQTLRSGEFSDEEIRVGMDVNSEGNQEVLLKAAEQIRKIVDGEWPLPLIRQATTGFQQKIINYAIDHAEDFEMDIFNKLMIYAKAHQQYVLENMARKAITDPLSTANQDPNAVGATGGAPASNSSGKIPVNSSPTAALKNIAMAGA